MTASTPRCSSHSASCDRRGRGEHLRAPIRYTRHEIGGRQAKMKAHHLAGSELLQHFGRRGDERGSRGLPLAPSCGSIPYSLR